MTALSHETFIQQYVLRYIQGGATGGHVVPLNSIIDQADHAWEAIKVKVADAKDERDQAAEQAKQQAAAKPKAKTKGTR